MFDPAQMLPAAGQGALGIEIRAGRADVAGALAALAHQGTWLAVSAERAVSRALGGSCSMPLAAFATLQGEVLRLEAAWGDPDQAGRLLRAQASGTVGSLEEAAALGAQVASRLRADGAH